MICIPNYVEKLMNKLEESGYEAFVVGGSLRDSMLEKEPSDFDLTTNAKPDKIEEIFLDYKTINIGKEFGTIIVVQEEGNIEITTYRIESDYKDGRRPLQVSFSNNIVEDLSRRDFTINSMAYNKNVGLIDPYNGKVDLENRLIRTVGNPVQRFSEDHLRILRGIRFAAQLNFQIEEKTYSAIKEESHSLVNISAERIYSEFINIFLSDIPSKGIKLMLNTGILKIIVPELMDTVNFNQKNPNHDKDVFLHSLCVLDSVPALLELRLAALFHDIGKPHSFTLDENNIGHFYGHDKISVKMTNTILTRLKAPNELINIVSSLISDHMSIHDDIGTKGLKRQIARLGNENIFKLIELQKADRLCSSPENSNIEFLVDRENEIKSILEYKEPYKKSQLVIDGNYIIRLGYKEGKLIGDILEYLLEEVLENPDLNQLKVLENIIMKKFPI